jgi:hypothetical protein
MPKRIAIELTEHEADLVRIALALLCVDHFDKLTHAAEQRVLLDVHARLSEALGSARQRRSRDA